MEHKSPNSSGIAEVLSRALGEPLSRNKRGTMEKQGYAPAIDVKETQKEYVLFVDLPGIEEDDIEFSWTENSLVLSGAREFDHDGEDAEDFIQIKRPYGPFMGLVEFAHAVDTNQATAKYRRGVLKIRLPKKMENRS